MEYRTSAPHTALPAEPFPFRYASNALSDAAGVVGCGAAVAADQITAKRTQGAYVHVLIVIVSLRLRFITVKDVFRGV